MTTSSSREHHGLTRLNLIFSVVIKLFTVVGGLFALYVFLTGQHYERRRVSLEEVFRAKSPEVTQALVRLERVYRPSDFAKSDSALDLASVMTWYDHLGMLWLHDPFVDKCVIKAAVAPHAEFIATVLNTVNYPVERRKFFDNLLNRMADYPC